MELYVLDRELNRLGLIDDYKALMWERFYSKPGKFTLELIPDEYKYSLLKNGNLLVKNDGSHEVMYIDDIDLSENDDGVITLKVEGLNILSYLDRRITQREQKVSGDAETVIRTYIDTNCINTEASRIIPHLKLGDYKGLGDKLEYNAHYKEVLDEVCKIAELQNLGIKASIDIDSESKDIVIDIYEGLDRTENQTENVRAYFSEDYENIGDTHYNYSCRDFKNTCLVAGAGEGKNRKTLMIGNENIGLDRYEVFIDARDISDVKGESETPIPIEEYNKLLKTRGDAKLSEYDITESFEGEALDTEGVRYKLDYDLGDLVTVYDDDWGIQVQTRIVGITEHYTEDGLNIDVQFGNKKPDVLKKIKRRLS